MDNTKTSSCAICRRPIKPDFHYCYTCYHAKFDGAGEPKHKGELRPSMTALTNKLRSH